MTDRNDSAGEPRRSRPGATPGRGSQAGKSDRPRRPRQDGKAGDKPRWSKDAKRSEGDRPFRSDRPRADATRGDQRRSEGERPRRGESEITRAPRPKIDFPLIPDEILAEDLHISVRAQLKTLSQENQEFVARHLQMVALLIDSDPALAHRHALAASKKGGRLAVVRETLGITAYTTGDYTLALRELLTHRRISGSNDQLPLIVDCERGLGRPERAIEAAVGVDRAQLEVGVRINLAIALSGARLDLGQPKLAQQELEIKELSPKRIFEQSPLLFRSYAEVLRELGKDGSEWDDLADRAERALAEQDGEILNLIEEMELPTRRPKRDDAAR